MAAAPDLRLPSIDGLRAFEATARLGTFERAAEELSVTASAVSKRVAQVEDLLGQALFTRGGKAPVLTAAGREYLALVSSALALLWAMPQHRRSAQQRTRLRVSTPPTFARLVLLPVLEQFTQAHPALELEVALSVPFLDAGRDDGAVQIRHGSGLPGVVLMRDRVLPLAAPALLARVGALRTPADLARAPLLRTPIEPWAPWFRAAGLQWPEPDAGPKLLDLGLTLEAALAGQGVVLARPSLARHWLRQGALRPLFNITAEPAGQYHLLNSPVGAAAGTPPDGAADPSAAAAQAFAQWLQAQCAQVAAEADAELRTHLRALHSTPG